MKYMENILQKLPNENEAQYVWRIGQAKDAGLIESTWEELTPTLNLQCGIGEEDYRGESAWRKRYRVMQQSWDDVFSKLKFTDEHASSIKEQTDELYKAKRQLFDQRREYNKILTSDARADHLVERLIEAANIAPLKDYSNIFTFKSCASNEEAVLLLSDWHYGQVSNNIWNQYDTSICLQRVSKLFDKVSAALTEHEIKTLHVVLLGDFVNGAIHTGCRVASEEDTCEQLMHVSEILANFINSISICVESVNVHSTYGNHARTIQNKDDSIHSDNMERVIPWWLRQRLMKNNKVHVIDSEFYEFIYFNVCGYNVVCTHGDLDKFRDIGVTINSLFSKKYGKTIDYTFSGDKHHLESFEQFGVESALVGSLCGTDEYANSKRLYANPMQTLCIFAPEDGKLCTYNIKL
jgi:hypothetical protein